MYLYIYVITFQGHVCCTVKFFKVVDNCYVLACNYHCSSVCLSNVQLFGGMFSDKDEEMQERDEFRKDRAKERQRERNIARAAPDKRFACLSRNAAKVTR